MKRLTLTWKETATYEVEITVPDDYPETVDQVEEHAVTDDGDWFQIMDRQQPKWATMNLLEANDRELLDVQRSHTRASEPVQEPDDMPEGLHPDKGGVQ